MDEDANAASLMQTLEAGVGTTVDSVEEQPLGQYVPVSSFILRVPEGKDHKHILLREADPGKKADARDEKKPLDLEPVLSKDEHEKFLRKIEEQTGKLRDVLWDKAIVPLLAFELASSELGTRLELVLNDNEHLENPITFSIELRNYLNALKLSSQTAVINYVGEQLDLPKKQVRDLLRGLSASPTWLQRANKSSATMRSQTGQDLPLRNS